MFLYLIERRDAEDCGYDRYLGAVVVAASEAEARCISPDGERRWYTKGRRPGWRVRQEGMNYPVDVCWVPPEQVIVRLIGVAADLPVGVVLANYLAG